MLCLKKKLKKFTYDLVRPSAWPASPNYHVLELMVIYKIAQIATAMAQTCNLSSGNISSETNEPYLLPFLI